MNQIIRHGARYGLIFLIAWVAVFAVFGRSQASPVRQFDDPVEQGRYLTTIAGCVDCHTPLQAAYQDQAALTPAQIRTLAFFSQDTLDEERLFAGGKVFDLGPLGAINVPNLTPDAETGLGEWTDEEIKAAFLTGLHRDGRTLFPLMPYRVYNNMAESDADAIVAYLRSLPPIRNDVPSNDHIPTDQLRVLPRQTEIVAPDPADTAERGRYLVRGVMGCTDCHTPNNPQTGEPIMEQYLGGGQPFEGPWGIVYGGNITPHETSGLAGWSDTDIRRVFAAGVRRDGRRLIVMPWQFFGEVTPEDMDAVIYYLRHDLEPVDNQVPAVAIDPAFVEYVEIAAEPADDSNTTIVVAGIIGAAVIVALAILAVFARRRS
jgi:mono/diheme cytochrome c family protein